MLIARDMDGGIVNAGLLRGKVVLVQFWATWCPYCRAEMPGLDALYRRDRSKGLEIIAVSIDNADKRDKVLQVMQPYSFRTVMADGLRVNDFGVPKEIPLVYVLDKNGVLRYSVVPDGQKVTVRDIEGAITPLL